MGNAGGCYDTLAQKINEIKESELALSSAGAWELDCSIHVFFKYEALLNAYREMIGALALIFFQVSENCLVTNCIWP